MSEITEEEARNRLRAMIDEEGLSVAAFAAKIGRDRSHVSEVLKGNRVLSDVFLKYIRCVRRSGIHEEEDW